MIKRNFNYLSQDALVLLFKSLIRSHLEYANSVWCPYKKADISSLEKVQRRATKMIKAISHLSYTERLKKLKLPTLKYRRNRGDMIEVYKIVHGHYKNASSLLSLHSGLATRGNMFKLNHGSFMHASRKYFFSNRVVSLWNSLSNNVVNANSINSFKGRLDKFWSNQDILYDWESEFMTGTGIDVIKSVFDA
jgi:ribonucleases P/MRP protein subunit RPP40